MKAKIFTQSGQMSGDIDLPDEVFNAEINEHLMHLVVKGYLANQRQGTSKTKGRSEVSGGGLKPWRQKGTGHARAGSNTSPVWVRGGKAFGPDPRDYYRTIPKKMRHKALCSALSSRAKDEKVVVIDNLSLSQPKTKQMAEFLKAISFKGKKNLIITDTRDRITYLSGRNIANLLVKPLCELNTYDVLNSENIIFAGKELVGKTKEVVAP
jgi:large subunit ribosomal protein L4